MQIGCVVMASGHSRRFGENKLLAPLAGRPLIAHSLARLAGLDLAKTVVVTIYPQVAALAAEMGFEVATPAGPGRDDTVRAGLAPLRGLDGCLFCVGDQPLCRAQSVQAMLDVFRAHPGAIVRLYSGDTPGNPVLLPRALFGELEALPPGKGGGWVVQRHGGLVIPVQAYSPWELADADTPEALAQLAAQLDFAGQSGPFQP